MRSINRIRLLVRHCRTSASSLRQLHSYNSSTVIDSFVNMQMLPAIIMASPAICRADRLECLISAFAAASANGPPEPIEAMPSSGSIKSPFPLSKNVFSPLATTRSACKCRKARSVRHYLASSTVALGRLPRNSSSLVSNLENNANASAVEPAKPARICPLYKRRILRALCLMTVSPRVTCPSPASATFPSLRTQMTVVLRIMRAPDFALFLLVIGCEQGVGQPLVELHRRQVKL